MKYVWKEGAYGLGVYTNNKAEFWIWSWGTFYGNRDAPGGTILTTRTWYCIAGRFRDRRYIETLVNGALDRAYDIGSEKTIDTVTQWLAIGQDGSGRFFFNGAIALVYIYRCIFTEEEMKALCAGLI